MSPDGGQLGPLEGSGDRGNLTSNSKKVYYPSSHDLRLGAQGYSSCSEHSPSDSNVTKSGQGADTYAGHMASYEYGPAGGDATSSLHNVRSSKKSVTSKAYGMEHGNWMGMDASIQNTTLQDTTTYQRIDESKLGGKPEGMQLNPATGGSIRPFSGPNSSRPMHSGSKPHGLSPIRGFNAQRGPLGAPTTAFFGDQSTIHEDTYLNQTQNRTLYQMTQTKALDLSGTSKDYFHQVSSPRKDGSQPPRQKYNLTLKIPYKTDYGESL